ncbi:MAG TPA: tetratricopeptide repeat protein, partial [Bacteroidota bacterium]|nr:tetratricopeptide repeat protein [Bacteroidota bacterium]
LRPAAEERVRYIETIEAKEKDAGLEKLALLVGDVVSEKDRAGLALRLGEIYFSDLKSYAAAVAQFDNALGAGLAAPRSAEALMKKAEALEYLSWNDAQMVPRAQEAYRAYIASGAAGADSLRALLALFRLSAATLPQAKEAAATLMATHPAFPMADTVELILGTLEEKADSLTEAETAFALARRTARDSVIAGEAAWGSLGILSRRNLPDSALAAGAAFLASFPASPHTAILLARMGELAMQRARPRDAAAYYQRLTGEYGYAAAAEGAEEKLGLALGAAGETDAALSVYTAIAGRAADDPAGDGKPPTGVLLALGKLSWQAGKGPEAKRFLAQVLSREQTGPAAGEAYTTLGMISRAGGDRDAATSYFRQAQEAAPGTTVSRDIADLLFDNGDYADAIRDYTQLSHGTSADSDRQYFDARIILAALRSGDAAGAAKRIQDFTKAHTGDRDDMALFDLEKGLLQFRKEEYPGAMKTFENVADKYEETPSGPAAMYWIGKTLEATGKQPEAIAALEKLLGAHPDAPIISHVHLALGNLYYAAEKWDEAIKHYRTIVDDPHPDAKLLPPAMSNLIETYETAGAFDGALTLTRKYLELYPNAEDALDKKIKIGILYDRLGYYDQAVLQLQSLLDEAGSDLEGEIRYYIAESNFHKGDYQQAILDFLKVPYLVTKKGKIDWTANALYMSGQSYEKMGRYDQALTMYQQIVDRPGIDATFKSAARKEIDRVRSVLNKKPG